MEKLRNSKQCYYVNYLYVGASDSGILNYPSNVHAITLIDTANTSLTDVPNFMEFPL